MNCVIQYNETNKEVGKLAKDAIVVYTAQLGSINPLIVGLLAAGAVLTKHLPEEEVWSGNPAKFMMQRSEYESKR